jgi:hypothetical protein
MAWNQRSKVLAVAFAIQSVQGTFVQPNTTTDLLAVANATNTHDVIEADDPTATGAIWDAPKVYLGQTATIGGSIPLRGPGGASPPAANGWAPGRILQAGGWAEIRKATSSTGAVVAGSTTTAFNLAVSESSVDDFLLGAPLQHAVIGTGFRATTLIQDYAGAGRVATIPETLGSAPTAATTYTIPAYLSYVLGTLTTSNPYLSVSVWRDKKRYDYRDWQPASIAINVPVANEANTGFPDMAFSGKALIVGEFDDTTPTLAPSVLATAIAPARGGKFYLDRVKLGHQNTTFTASYTVAAASNQNQDAGQDGYDVTGGSRQVALDLNQMAVTDFAIATRVGNRTVLPIFETWGLGAGNNWGFIVPNTTLSGFSPGDRNGYVNLTGNAETVDIDKSAALTIWWT